ncbi:MAG: hypothetical protein SVT52_07190 [Planctomycetota bacterium]|nr:hypothetical protein [Planctomycetota bacterium]
MNPETERQIRQSIQQAARDGKVACKVLLELAERMETPPKQIGQFCNEMNIRIAGCQLGCFR